MQKYPAGFYVLGVELIENQSQNSLVEMKRWSLQALRMLSPGETYTFSTTIQYNSKCFTVHAWGLCRLESIRIGMENYLPIDGALFIDIDKVITPGKVLKVIVTALDFEPMTTIRGFEPEPKQ